MFYCDITYTLEYGYYNKILNIYRSMKGNDEMDYHYAHEYLVGYSDVDKNNQMKLSRIVDLLQNIATWHSKTIGYGTAEMKELKLGWLVLAWRIKILKYPEADEYIEIRTWSKKPKGLHAYRDFEIINKNGEKLVLVESSWVLYDLVNRKPIKMIPEMSNGYGVIERDAIEEGISKIKPEKIEGEKLEILVSKRDIDTNNHVNNARYLDFFEEILPENEEINEIEVQYRNQTMLGEKLLLTFDGTTCIMQNENGEINVTIKILETNRDIPFC